MFTCSSQRFTHSVKSKLPCLQSTFNLSQQHLSSTLPTYTNFQHLSIPLSTTKRTISTTLQSKTFSKNLKFSSRFKKSITSSKSIIPYQQFPNSFGMPLLTKTTIVPTTCVLSALFSTATTPLSSPSSTDSTPTTSTSPQQSTKINFKLGQFQQPILASTFTHNPAFYFEKNHKFPTLPHHSTDFDVAANSSISTATIQEIDSTTNQELPPLPTPSSVEIYPPLKPLPQSIIAKDVYKSLIPTPVWGLNYEALPSNVKRTIFIGDIHGCYDELIKTLEEVDYDPHTDILVALGDIVGKGPKSMQVFDFFYNLQLYVVNHIDKPNQQQDTTLNQDPKPFEQLSTKMHKLMRLLRGTPLTAPDSKLTTIMRSKVDEVDVKYMNNATKLHHNSRVFVLAGNHEHYVTAHQRYLRHHSLLPELAPLASPTHAHISKFLFSHVFHKSNPQSPLTLELNAQIKKQLDSIPTSEQLHANKEAVHLFQMYSKHATKVQADLRFTWLLNLPQYILLPQLNIACVHAGIPPDACTLFATDTTTTTPTTKMTSTTNDGIPSSNNESIHDEKLQHTELPFSTNAISPQLMVKETEHDPYLSNQPISEPHKSIKIPVSQQSSQISSTLSSMPKVDFLNMRFAGTTPAAEKKTKYSTFNITAKANKSKDAITRWSKVYSERILNHQFQHPEDGTNYPHIIFGHDAAAGLQLEPYTTGLDTGCCYGGVLSSLVCHIDPNKPSQGFQPATRATFPTSTETINNQPTTTVSYNNEGELPFKRHFEHQAEFKVPMKLDHSIHTEQPVLIQMPSLQPRLHED